MLLLLFKVCSKHFGLEILFWLGKSLPTSTTLVKGEGEGQTQGKPYLFAYLDHLDIFFLNSGENYLLKP